MKYVPLTARVLLGLIFLVYGVIEFEPVPEPGMGPEAAAFIGALMDTGYLWQLLKVLEIVCGILLIVGRFVPLALVLLAPIALNGVLFHLLLARDAKTVAALAALALGLYLAWQYRSSFRGVLQSKAPLG